MNSRDGTAAFLPLNTKIVGEVNDDRPSVGQFLTREQTRYIYKKTESGEIINTETIQQELEQERQLDKIDDMNGETNPCKELIVNNAEKVEPLMTQMEEWSILSNTYHSLSISAINKHKINTKEKGDTEELDFGVMPEVLKEEHLDVYDGIRSEVVSTTRFDENSDISTTYLGRSNREKCDKLKVEESFPISEQGYTLGKLFDGTECQ